MSSIHRKNMTCIFPIIEDGAMSSAGKPAMEITYHLPRVLRTHATFTNDHPNRSAMH